MAESKTTLPWLSQYPAWTLFGSFSPQGYRAFKKVKPKMFEQVFGDTEEADLAPYRRYTQEYDPFSFLTNAYPRPGGPSQEEQDILNNSLFGSTARLNLGGANAAAANQANFTNFISPMAPGGGAGGGGGYGALTGDIFTSLGGRMPYPTQPTAPTIPGFNMPGAPSLPPFQTPNVGGLAADTWQRFSDMVPGFSGSLERALNPQIALPEQSIFEMVAAQRGQGGPMDAYVQQALGGLQESADRRLQKQSMDLQSRFAGEGSYMSGPMFNALGELSASSNADLAATMGQLQLGAAEGEANRIFGGATTQYENEANRNALQAQIGAQTAQQLADVFGQIAATTGSAEAAAAADAYRAQAGFLSSIYGSQTDAAARAYGTQVGGMTDIFGTQAGMYNTGLNAAVRQQEFVTQAATQRARDLAEMYGMSFDQAMQLAKAEQGNQQSALDALRRNYYQPGENLLETMRPYFGLPQVTTPMGGGMDWAALAAAAGTAAVAAGV